ncbi:hypothetical protein KC851_00320 [Candidatus Kaiserbacteria bacterium]|nr:hypothetical protein [Candidatus Kaiserbacteria bacterium]
MDTFDNPLVFNGDYAIVQLLSAILQVFMIISTPVVIFFLIYAGFMYVTGRGNPEKIKAASRALLYGIIGGVVILGSMAIVKIVDNIVSNF